MNHLRYATIAAAIVCVSGLMHAQEKKLGRAQLPPAVQKAVDQQSAGATVKGFSTEVENGKRLYEAEMMVNGHSRDIEMDASGNVTEVEEEVSISALPAAVKDGIAKKAGAGQVTKVESLTKHGKLVAYEASIATGGRHSEVQVGPSGGTLPHEE
ncbi:MAG: PepSY-like domain-containing protein [Acidobacteriaceae bacterium]